MTILPWAGVGRNTLRLLRHFWDCQQVVAKQGGCYGEAFKPTRGTTQGDVISPTLFNIEVDAILRCWFLDLGLPDSTQKSLKPVVQDFHVLFYVDDGYVGSSISPQLQTAFDKLIQLFDRVGLRTNPNKTKAMTCTPGYLRAVAYKRRRLSCRKISATDRSTQLSLKIHSSLSASANPAFANSGFGRDDLFPVLTVRRSFFQS